MVDNAQLALRIKTRAQEQNISVMRLLQECKIRPGLIYDLEKKDKSPSVQIIADIADALQCSTDYLLGRTDKPDMYE